MSQAIAWVESPLQLVAAAEWAALRDEPITVAVRIGSAQMAATAEELRSRGARFAECVPFYGVPWGLLSGHREWAIGDGFSGQFRLALSLLRPRRLSLLDDGAQTVALADALLERTGFSRPGQHESTLATVLGALARARMLGLAFREALTFSTAFELGDDRMTALAGRGVRVIPHRLNWVRHSARPIRVPGNRVLLGSARPVDGLISPAQYLAWVASEALCGEFAYLPHRRETPAMLGAVAALPGVRVLDTGLPVELVLAGSLEPLEVLTLQSSATTTLAHVLRGTGSTIRHRTVTRSTTPIQLARPREW